MLRMGCTHFPETIQLNTVSFTGKAQQYEGLMIKQVMNSCGHFGKKPCNLPSFKL